MTEPRTPTPAPTRDRNATDRRGPQAEPVELEKRLERNAQLERQAAQGERAHSDAKGIRGGGDGGGVHPEPPAEKDSQGRSVQSDLDDALDDSFPASDPPARSSPVSIGSPRGGS